eukprot:TRINITY_DN1176_c0_g1_i1.p1 TRINITY_DN1176_c0_g1~~TRINITY_DN1176_c0_g1_i1.p1  ORF type:complete len:618 (-),score=184.02 TRINITY_DN1176_c0_g1_i1:315-2111(-)
MSDDEAAPSTAAQDAPVLKKTKKSSSKSKKSSSKSKKTKREPKSPRVELAPEDVKAVEEAVDMYLRNDKGAADTTALLQSDISHKEEALVSLVELIPYLKFNPSGVLNALSQYVRGDAGGTRDGLMVVLGGLSHWVTLYFVRDFPNFSLRRPGWDKSIKSKNIVVDMIEELFELVQLMEAAVCRVVASRFESDDEQDIRLVELLNKLKLGIVRGFKTWKRGGAYTQQAHLMLRRNSGDSLVQPVGAVTRRGSLGSSGSSSSNLFKSIFGRKKSSSTTPPRTKSSSSPHVRRASSATIVDAVKTADELEDRVDLFSRMPGSVESRALGQRVEPLAIATALTHMARGMLMRVRPVALIRKNWTREEYVFVPSVRALCDMQLFFNQVSFWVAAAVCRVEDLELRGWMIEFFITIAAACREQHNYSSMMAVMSGLNNISISRMKRAWVEVLPDNLRKWEDLGKLMNTKSNYGNYRAELDAIDGGYVPFMGVLTRDITFIEEGNTYFLDDESTSNVKLNIEKLQMVGSVVADLNRAQRPMELEEEPEEMVGHLLIDIRRVCGFFALFHLCSPRFFMLLMAGYILGTWLDTYLVVCAADPRGTR